MKHAYLILAHTEFEILRLLVKCLDDARNDIYIHFDRKVRVFPNIPTSHSRLFILNNRIDVRWGDYSVVEAEYALFEVAIKNSPYAYYHLLSGVDLPLKSQNYIHQFFDAHQGQEFIGYTLTSITPEIVRKVQRWHLFPNDFKNESLWKRIMRAGFIKIQEQLGIKRNKSVDFKKGSQWVSITEEMVALILQNKKDIKSIYTHTFCPDELFIQTLCYSSPLRENIYKTDAKDHECIRVIGWENGELIDWDNKDYLYLKSSKALFARKFNSKDTLFIERILELSKE